MPGLNQNENKKELWGMVVIISFIMFATGLYIAFIGMHNIDNAWNMLQTKHYYNLSYVTEETIGGNILEPNVVYMRGLKSVVYGAILLITSPILIGYGIGRYMGGQNAKTVSD